MDINHFQDVDQQDDNEQDTELWDLEDFDIGVAAKPGKNKVQEISLHNLIIQVDNALLHSIYTNEQPISKSEATGIPVLPRDDMQDYSMPSLPRATEVEDFANKLRTQFPAIPDEIEKVIDRLRKAGNGGAFPSGKEIDEFVNRIRENYDRILPQDVLPHHMEEFLTRIQRAANRHDLRAIILPGDVPPEKAAGL